VPRTRSGAGVARAAVEAPTMLTATTSEIRRDMNDSMLLIDFALAKIDTFSEAA
jgi:hypothetical protein